MTSGRLARMMQTLFENLFNLIRLLKISLFVVPTKIFQQPSVKSTLRYQKINFLTTSASSQKCIVSNFCGLFFILCSLLFALCIVSNSYAAHPLITDDTGTQGTGKFQLEVNGEYSNDNGNIITEIAATLSAGIRDNIDLVVRLPYQFLRNKAEGGIKTSDNGISDMSVELKWRFYEKDGLGFALKPGVTLPTGDEKRGLGEGKAGYSLFFITSKETEPWEFHLNLGYKRNENKIDERKNIWHASLAVECGVIKNLDIAANIGIERNPDKASHTHPAFLIVGLIYSFSEKFDIDFGIKTGLNKTEPDYTLLAGITLRL